MPSSRAASRAQIVRDRIGERLEFGAGGARVLKRMVEPRIGGGERDAQFLVPKAKERDGAGQRRDRDQRQDQRHGRSSSVCAMFAASSDGS
jgi:hypothetical protein